ncbi:hypothetical protein WMF01_12200 [Sorangium sp. So ce1667]
MSNVRERAAEFARALNGIGAGPDTRGQYIDLIAPGESPRMRAWMADMSGCALVAAGVWRAVGVRHRLLEPPYKVQTAVSRLVAMGVECGAMRRPRADRLTECLPQPGDVVWVGQGIGTHVYVAIDVGLRSGIPVLYALDGGQRDDDGNPATTDPQIIYAKEHVWTASGREVLDIARRLEPGERWGAQRPVQGWIDLVTIVAAFGGKA